MLVDIIKATTPNFPSNYFLIILTMNETQAIPTKASTLPVFYTRDSDKYNGTKVTLNAIAREQGKKNAQFKGDLGNIQVHLWEVEGPRGVFFNVKTANEQGEMIQLGTANAFVNGKGFNALSMSLRYDSEEGANAARESIGFKEAIKPVTRDGKTTYYVNIYSDVSRRAIEANKPYFAKAGFRTEFEAVQK